MTVKMTAMQRFRKKFYDAGLFPRTVWIRSEDIEKLDKYVVKQLKGAVKPSDLD